MRWEPNIVGRFRELLVRHGGFTVDLVTGEHLASGVAVCVDPAASLWLALSDWEPGVVARWLDAHGPTRCVGGWLDPVGGQVCLDRVVVFPSSRRFDAIAVGRRHRQQAVFDLDANRMVRLTEDAVG